MGSSTENSAYGPAAPPVGIELDPGRFIRRLIRRGGRLRGGAVTLGTDTGGSIREPAAVSGIVGTKPTYGGSSRYGVVAFASSPRHAGTVRPARARRRPAARGDVRARPDGLHLDRRAGAAGGGRGPRGGREAACGSAWSPSSAARVYQPGVLARFAESVELLESLGAKVIEVSCPHFRYALPAYYLIAPASARPTWPRFDAMRYGLRVGDDGTRDPEEVMALTREQGFGAEVKRRIMLGTYALSSGYYDAYYGKAQQVRHADHQGLRRGLRPGATCSIYAGRRTPAAFRSAEDAPTIRWRCTWPTWLTIPSDLAGNAAMSVPCGLRRPGRAADPGCR